MRIVPSLLGTALLLAACSGGSGGGGGGGPPRPVQPYSVTTNTTLAIAGEFGRAAAIVPRVLVAVSEFEMARDLNGDGDQLDRVLHEVDTVTGLLLNHQLAVVGPILTSDTQFAFLVNERDQAGLDLNGDGDATDSVWFAYDPVRGPPVNLAIATPLTGLGGAGTRGGFVLLQSEGASGNTDLNSDFDAADEVGRMFDGNTFALVAQVIGPHSPASPLVARNGRVLFLSAEPNFGPAGSDFNGDGDRTDKVLGVVDFTAGAPAFTNLARSVANHPYVLTDGAAAYFIDEAGQGATDFNNDGDTNDAILAVRQFLGSLESLPTTPALPQFAVACAPSRGIAAGRDRIIVGLGEAANANRDLNADGDALDVVVGWVNVKDAPAAVHVRPFALSQIPSRIDGTRGVVAVSEANMGILQGTDLNGDGDASDAVAFRLDTTASPGTMTNLNFAVSTVDLVGEDALLGVPEAGDRMVDLNGNGKVEDTVLVYFSLEVNPVKSRGLAMVSSELTYFRFSATEIRLAVLLREGQSPTFNDLNQDGDTDDTGLKLVAINPSRNPPALISPTPFFAGTAALGAGSTPPLQCGADVFLFPTSEAMANMDLNGDGDKIDTVLSYTTILPPPP